MKAQSSFERARDQHVASAAAVDAAQLCSAPGCPAKWSVRLDGSVAYCRWHAWADRRDWPVITAELQDAAMQREHDKARAAAAPPPAPMSRAEKLSVVETLKAMAERMRHPHDPRAWVDRLLARQEAGEQLNAAQLHCLDVAMHGNAGARLFDEVDPDEQARREDEKRRQLAQLEQYAFEHGIELEQHEEQRR